MKLKVLMENTARHPSLTAEHGLSLYIETGDKRLLFDTGASGAFVQNARKMGVDLSAVDALILSHGHYDHGGGISAFLSCNDRAPVYLSEQAFGAFYNASGKYIGLDAKLRDNPRLITVRDRLQLTPDVALECCPGAPGKIEPRGLQVLQQGKLQPDCFSHELYLVIRERGKRICFSGCAHRGVENILRWLEPEVFIGGFHFKDIPADAPRLEQAAAELLARGCEYYTCHCTGQAQYDRLKQIMGSRLHRLSTGDHMEI